jgi:hypothetical protein
MENTEKLSLKKDIEIIVQAFVSQCNAAGLETPFVPEVVIENTPQLIFYDNKVLTAPFWNDFTADQQALFVKWASDAEGDFTGEDFFKLNFNWFLVPHEMGHFVQGLQNSKLNLWDAERNANCFAVAFWRMQNKLERLDTIYRWSQQIWNTLPNPTPAGQDPETYFNNNYDTLGADPDAYGYYQFLFYKMAFESTIGFDQLIDEGA